MSTLYMGAAVPPEYDMSTENGRITALEDIVGDTAMTTTAQTLTGAVNELDEDIGTNVNAISNINTTIGDTTLPTTSQTLTGAIAELNTDISHCATRAYFSNPALTSSEGTLTCTINTPQAPYCTCGFYLTATGEEFQPSKVTHANGHLTVEIESSEDVLGDTYTAIVVG